MVPFIIRIQYKIIIHTNHNNLYILWILLNWAVVKLSKACYFFIFILWLHIIQLKFLKKTKHSFPMPYIAPQISNFVMNQQNSIILKLSNFQLKKLECLLMKTFHSRKFFDKEMITNSFVESNKQSVKNISSKK